MARIKSFRCSSKISAEVNKVWYSFEAGIELEIDENDNLADVKKKAWNTVDMEIEKQIKVVTEPEKPTSGRRSAK